MKVIETTLPVTLCSAAHVDIETDTVREVKATDITSIVPVDPEFGIGRAIVFLIDGSSLNVLESVEDLLQMPLLCSKTIIRNKKVLEANHGVLHD